MAGLSAILVVFGRKIPSTPSWACTDAPVNKIGAIAADKVAFLNTLRCELYISVFRLL